MISLGTAAREGDWTPPVLQVIATRGDGVDQLAGAIEEHRVWLERTGAGLTRRRERAGAEIQGIALAALQARFAAVGGDGALAGLAQDVAAGRLDAFTAADRIVAGLTG